MTTSSLMLRDLHLYYGDFHALKGVTLEMEPGSFLALLGPSGCGKTSLLRTIAGFNVPQKGTIEIGGKNIIPLAPRERGLGFVFQNYALFPHLSARDNIAFGLKCRGVGKTELRARTASALAMVSLSDLAERKPSQLSGGQQQRVALARALVIEPSVLLLDEPLGALDKKLRTEMQSELKALQHRLGVTSVFVTHDQEEAMAMADTIAIMNEGEIEQIASPREIFTSPKTAWVAQFVGCGNVLQGNLVRGRNGAPVLDVAPGCALELAPGLPNSGRASGFVRAEQVSFQKPDGPTAFEIVSHRYLGVHVEVVAAYPKGVIKALLAPDLASDLGIGTKVVICVQPSDCRLIPA